MQKWPCADVMTTLKVRDLKHAAVTDASWSGPSVKGYKTLDTSLWSTGTDQTSSIG